MIISYFLVKNQLKYQKKNDIIYIENKLTEMLYQMIKDYLMLFAAVILLALSFAVNKVYQNKNGSGLAEGIKFNMLSGFFTAAVFFALQGFTCGITVFSLITAAASAVLCAVYTILGFKIMENGQMAFYTIFLLTGGMTVPYIWGILFLDEPFTLLRTAGLIIIAAAVVISNGSGGKTTRKQLALCIAVFIINGFVSVISKEHSVSAAAVSSTDFLILNSAAKAVICFVIYLFMKKPSQHTDKYSGKTIFIIVVSAVIGGASWLLQLIGAQTLPATVLYPIVTGGSIICTAAAGRIFFGEKPDRRMIFSIILCFAGTCMFL